MEGEDYDPKKYSNFPPEYDEEDYDEDYDEEDPAQQEDFQQYPAQREYFQEDDEPGPSSKPKKKLIVDENKEQLQQFLNNTLHVKTSPTAGKESYDLYKNSELTFKKKGEILGIEYKGKRVVVKKGEISENISILFYVNEFKKKLANAHREYLQSEEYNIEQQSGIFNNEKALAIRNDFVLNEIKEINSVSDVINSILNHTISFIPSKISLPAPDAQKALPAPSNAQKALPAPDAQKALPAPSNAQKALPAPPDAQNIHNTLNIHNTQNTLNIHNENRPQQNTRELQQYKQKIHKQSQQHTRELQQYKQKIHQQSHEQHTQELQQTMQQYKQIIDHQSQQLIESAKLQHQQTEHLEKTISKKDKTIRDHQNKKLKAQHDSLQNELTAEKKSRKQAQEQLEEIMNNKDILHFRKDEIVRMNSTILDIIHEESSTEEMIDKLRNEKKYWQEKIQNEPDPNRKVIFENLSFFCERSIDILLVDLNRPPESEEGKESMNEIIENHEFTKLERFKEWVKRNANSLGIGVGVTTAIITIASLVAKTLYNTRKSGENTANEVEKLSRKFNNLFPGSGALLSLLSKTISLVSNHLVYTILAILFFTVSYLYTKKQRNR